MTEVFTPHVVVEEPPVDKSALAVKPKLDPLEMIQMLHARGVPPDQMAPMYDLAKQWKADVSREAYFRDMAACQTEMPLAVRGAENKFLKSKYVKLEDLQAVAKPVYTKHGFSLSWGEGTTDKPGYVRVTCDIMHQAGHVERKFGDYPMDGKGKDGNSNMNPLQGRVSSNTYAQRDMLRSIFNITVADTDLDGNDPDTKLQPEQIEKLNVLIEKITAQKKPYNSTTFLGLFGLKAKDDFKPSLEDIPFGQFDTAVRILEQRLGAK